MPSSTSRVLAGREIVVVHRRAVAVPAALAAEEVFACRASLILTLS